MNRFITPLPEEEFLPDILLYQCDAMYIAVVKSYMDFLSPGSHTHEGYEFMIPLLDMPFLKIGKKNVFGCKNHIISINPYQEHGVSAKMAKVRFINILIDRTFLNEIAYEVYQVQNVEFHNDNYSIQGQMQTLVQLFIEEARQNAPGKYIQLGNLSRSIALHILRLVMQNESRTARSSSGCDHYKIKYVIDYIQDNHRTDCSLLEMANISGMSQYHFIRLFKKSTGKTPHEYLLDMKIEKAKQLLMDKDKTIIEICFESGFNNTSHFTRIFKKRTGTTPSLYRSMI